MIKYIVIFLIRIKLGLRKYEHFQFVGQKNSHDYYFFTNIGLVKYVSSTCCFKASHVGLNWLLDDECEIKKLND